MPAFRLTAKARADLRDIGATPRRHGAGNNGIAIFPDWMRRFISWRVGLIEAVPVTTSVRDTANIIRADM
jgi:hypothetical protein